MSGLHYGASGKEDAIMTELSRKHCTVPKKGTPPMDRDEAEALLAQLHDDWHISPDGRGIRRDFTFRNFHETIEFVNALAWICNRQDHHPDLEVSYKHCVVNFSTHAVDGLSENDFICAARADALLS